MRLADIRNDLEKGSRVTLLMRHAERPPLEPGDTTFGAHLSLTERGFATARRYGEALLKGMSRQRVISYAGNTLRTIQTVTCINDGLRDKGGVEYGYLRFDDFLSTVGPHLLVGGATGHRANQSFHLSVAEGVCYNFSSWEVFARAGFSCNR